MMEIAIAFVVITALLALGVWIAPKGWRSWVFNGISIALVALGAMLELASGFEWKEILPPNVAPWVVMGIALANVGLRAVTTTRVGMKRPEAPETPQDVVKV